jgi:hypothetical protein
MHCVGFKHEWLILFLQANDSKVENQNISNALKLNSLFSDFVTSMNRKLYILSDMRSHNQNKYVYMVYQPQSVWFLLLVISYL